MVIPGRALFDQITAVMWGRTYIEMIVGSDNSLDPGLGNKFQWMLNKKGRFSWKTISLKLSSAKLQASCSDPHNAYITRWRHQMETFSALLALCAGNSLVSGKFPSQRPVTRSFDVLFDLRLNIRLSKQSWGWWFETPSCSLWRHCNVTRWYAPLDSMTVSTWQCHSCWRISDYLIR